MIITQLYFILLLVPGGNGGQGRGRHAFGRSRRRCDWDTGTPTTPVAAGNGRIHVRSPRQNITPAVFNRAVDTAVRRAPLRSILCVLYCVPAGAGDGRVGRVGACSLLTLKRRVWNKASELITGVRRCFFQYVQLAEPIWAHVLVALENDVRCLFLEVDVLYAL